MTKQVGALPKDPAPPVLPVSRSAIRHLLLFWYFALTASLLWTMFDPWGQFAAFGITACLIVTIPLTRERYDLLSPWSLLVLVIYIGCGIRSVFVALRIDGSRTIDTLFLLGENPEFFARPSWYYLAGVALMTATYMLNGTPATRQGPFLKWVAGYKFGMQFPFVVAGCAAVGLAAFYLYAQRTGGFDLASFSIKRTTISGLELDTTYQSHGHLRALSEFAAYGFWLAWAKFAHAGARHNLLSARGLILVGLFLNAALMPIYTSTRADVAYLLIVGVAIEMAVGRRQLKRGAFGRTGAALLVLLALLTAARVGTLDELIESPTAGFVNTVGDLLVYNRNFSDIPTTAQIIEAVPERLPYNSGESIAGWAFAPVPRAVWPEKPLISAGPTIGITIFGTERAGVPPGFIGEAYWAFGLAGLLGGCALLGYFLRRTYERFLPALRTPGVALVYAVVVFRLGESAMAGGIGYALFNATQSMVIVLALLLLSSGSSGPKTRVRPGCRRSCRPRTSTATSP